MTKIVKVTGDFTLEELASGVYAAIATTEGKALSNAGFVNLGQQTLLFDAFLNLGAARDLLRFAEELTGNPVTHVVNSHFHLDHVVGNQIFNNDVSIISSARTREILKTELPKALDFYQTNGASALQEREEQLKTETDEMTRHGLLNDLIFLRALVGESLEARLPNLIFTDQLTFYGSQRLAVLRAFPVGHTPGDVALYLPDDGILFMGDLLCSKNHPWLGAGDPDQLQAIFQELSHLNPTHVVPGHGPIGTKEAMMLESQYIAEVKRIAEQLYKAGKSPDEASLQDLSPHFANWDSKVCFGWNIGALMEKLNV